MILSEYQRLVIKHGGEVLELFGVPHDFPLFLQHGSRIFDKRTRLYRQASEARRQQLAEEYRTNE